MNQFLLPTIHLPEGGISMQIGNIFSYPAHMHSFYEMTLYEPFDGSISINGQSFLIDVPTAILISPADFHRIDAPNGANAKYVKLAFDADLFGDAAPKHSVVCRRADNFIVHLLHEIVRSQPQSLYQRQLVHTAVLALCAYGVRVSSSDHAPSRDLVKKAVQIIHESYRDEITLASVAQQLSVTPQYLSSIFKQCAGINFSKYLNGVRLRCAARDLSETHHSITQICELCGYRNFSHFLRSFKAMFGMSPSDYRKHTQI